MPKVTFVNKSLDTGGATIAALRLFKALKKHSASFEFSFLAQEGHLINDGFKLLSDSIFSKYMNFGRLMLEKLLFLPYERSREIRFQFSTAVTGIDISRHQLIRNADIIHLHWLYQGFLSIKGMDRLFNQGIPVVWTLHDMWPFTGGCHYPGDCRRYIETCGHCPFLKNPGNSDLSNQIHRKKEILFSKYNNIVFITCSRWLAEKARESSLLRNHRIEVIPNPIDTVVFSPGEKAEARKKLGIRDDKFIILFGAANIADKRKGFAFLDEALNLMKKDYPDQAANTELLVFGKTVSKLPEGWAMHNLNMISGDQSLTEVYRAADVFVLPSLEDNLPNTIMESLASGAPVVAFNTGGIPEMIDHLDSGYLADFRNTADLLKGILWIKSLKPGSLTDACRAKVLKNYHPQVVAKAYEKIYLSLL